MIVVAFALPAESARFISLLDRRERGSRRGEDGGSLAGYTVRVLHTGVGERAARASIGAFLNAMPEARAVLSCGFAGALSPALEVADVVIGENYSDAGLLERTRQALGGRRAMYGTLATVPDVLDAAAARETVGQRTGAVAADMETAVIAEACSAAGVPMLALRTISDTAASPFPVPASILFDVERQRTRYGALLLHIARHPASLLRLGAFTRQVAAARDSLADAITTLLHAGIFSR